MAPTNWDSDRLLFSNPREPWLHRPRDALLRAMPERSRFGIESRSQTASELHPPYDLSTRAGRTLRQKEPHAVLGKPTRPVGIPRPASDPPSLSGPSPRPIALA